MHGGRKSSDMHTSFSLDKYDLSPNGHHEGRVTGLAVIDSDQIPVQSTRCRKSYSFNRVAPGERCGCQSGAIKVDDSL
jgi:hypothetical protein